MYSREESILDAVFCRLEALLNDAGIKRGDRQDYAPFGLDAAYHLPDEDISLIIDVKESLFPYQVDKLASQFPALLMPRSQARLLVVASNASRSAIDKCAEYGINVLDEAGNGYFRLPRFYYHKFVAQKRMSSRSSPSSSIFSSKASRLIRSMLVSYPESCYQSDMADKTMVSRGYVSRIINKMIDAGYIRRVKERLYVVDPNRLLDDWAAAYRFDRHKRAHFAISSSEYSQGLQKFQQDMQNQNIRFAFTGWSAAYLRSPYGVPSSIVAYVDRLTPDMHFRSIHPVESKGNVMLLLPHDEGVFQFAQPGEFGECVADVQCYLDLKGLPGRASDQADVMREKRLAFEEVSDARR